MPKPYRSYPGCPLTPREFEAATSSIWYNPNSYADGRGNLGPAENIAFLRGAKFDNFGPIFWSDMKILTKSYIDLAHYLGFRDINHLNSALLTEGSKIFNRQSRPAPPQIPATASYPFPVFVAGGVTKVLSDKQLGDAETSAKSGRPAHGKPSIFDTGYVEANEVTPGASDDFGSFLGSFDYPGTVENP
jgi:hypothetical protein